MTYDPKPDFRAIKNALTNYNEDQERDDRGRFGSGGGGGVSTSTASALTDQEEAAIHDYQNTENYADLNASLRADQSVNSKYTGMRDGLDSALAKSTLDQEATLYRGVSLYDYQISEMGLNQVGTTFTDKGFVSTSTDRDAARLFGGTTMVVTAPAGSNALALGEGRATETKGEREVLLPRGSSFEVTAVNTLTHGEGYGVSHSTEIHVRLVGAS